MRWLVVVVLLVLPWSAAAQEEILSFDARIAVQPDGALVVTETLRVRAEGAEIKRGIYRDFPVEYREADGRISVAGFTVEEVTRNGRPEPFAVLRQGAERRLRIGAESVLLPAPSEQVYAYRYRSDGQLRAGDGLDELFWNVTGQDWAFPIRSASVTVSLPADVPIEAYVAFTGRRGENGTDFRVTGASGSTFRAETTRSLAPGEGFSVAVSWPQGAITIPPPRYTAATRPPRQIGGLPAPPLAAALAALIGTLALFWTWRRVGRDPAGGAIYPRFEPPEGLSPAAARYLQRQGFDGECLTAAILSMAVKGALRVREGAPSGLLGRPLYSLVPEGTENRPLSPGEAAAYRRLFPNGERLELRGDRINGARVDAARAALRSNLERDHDGASFNRNRTQAVGAVAIGLGAGVLLIGFAGRWSPVPIVAWGIGAAFAAGVAGVIGQVTRNLTIRIAVLVAVLAAMVLFGPLDLMWAAVRDAIGSDIGADRAALLAILLSGAGFGALAVVFGRLMAAPTRAGRDLLDALDGFELYMKTAEEERLNILNPPDKTPELFERLLPYAVGLGLTHEWTEKFAGVLRGAAARPGWYQGSGSFDTKGFSGSFGSAVAGASAPSSRSGSGFSGGGAGGGGGGGGGGGW